MTGLHTVAAAAVLAGALALPASASAAAAAPAGTPVSVAVIMPLTVPSTTTGLLGTEALETYTQPGGLLARQLDAVEGTSATVALDPMIVASIRVQGAGAPPDALDFLERLRALPNEVFLLAYADADPALAVQADMSGQLEPLGFDFAIDPADFGPAVSPTPTPTPDPTATSAPDPQQTPPPEDDGPPPLPDTAALLDWPTTLPRIAWPAEGSVGAESLEGLAELDYDEVLVAAADVSPTSAASVDLGAIDGLVVDEDVSSALRQTVYAATESDFVAGQGTLAAALRAEALRTPGRTIIATLDRRWAFGSIRLAEALNGIAVSPSADLTPLSAVLAGPRSAATIAGPSGDAGAERVATLRAVAEAVRAEAAYLRIADDPAPLTQPRRLALLGLAGVGWSVDPVGWEAATAEELQQAEATRDAVQIVEGSDQLLLSDISSLRLQVSNALPVAVTVALDVRPLRPILHVEQRSVTLSIEPDSTATATVPVEAITNGEVTVRAELRDRLGNTIGQPRSLNVILQAGWETAGTLIVGVLVVLIFGGGLVRAVLRRRRQVREGVAADGPAEGDG